VLPMYRPVNCFLTHPISLAIYEPKRVSMIVKPMFFTSKGLQLSGYP
jgi:hypothetical protein